MYGASGALAGGANVVQWRDLNAVPVGVQQLASGFAHVRAVTVAAPGYEASAPIYAYAATAVEAIVAGAFRVDQPGVGSVFVVGKFDGSVVARFFVPLSGSDGTLVLTQRTLNQAITQLAATGRSGALTTLRVDLDNAASQLRDLQAAQYLPTSAFDAQLTAAVLRLDYPTSGGAGGAREFGEYVRGLGVQMLPIARFDTELSAAVVRLGYPTSGGAGGAREFGEYIRALGVNGMATHDALTALGQLTASQFAVRPISFHATLTVQSYPAGPTIMEFQVPVWLAAQTTYLGDGSSDIANFSCSVRYRLGAGINTNPGVYIIRSHRMPPADSSGQMMVLFIEHVFEAGCTAPPQLTVSCTQLR